MSKVWASCAKGELAERRTSFCGFLGQSFFFKQTLFYLSLQVKLRLCFLQLIQTDVLQSTVLCFFTKHYQFFGKVKNPILPTRRPTHYQTHYLIFLVFNWLPCDYEDGWGLTRSSLPVNEVLVVLCTCLNLQLPIIRSFEVTKTSLLDTD